MKINFVDRLKILTIGAARVDSYVTSLEDYLVSFFNNTKYLYSKTNLFGQLLNVVKDTANILFYYHNDAVTENNVLTAQKEISLRHFAELSGVQVVRAISSSGTIRMELRPTFFSKFGYPIYIRKYAQLSNNENSILYLVDISDDQIVVNSSANTIYISLIQGTVKEATFIADGTKLFTCDLSDNDIIEESHIKVSVNGTEWTREDSLYDLTYDAESYFIRTGYTDQYNIVFGNGISGKCLSKGDIITVEYLTSVGESGNFDENIFPTFTFTSGIFDSTGESIDVADYSNIVKDSGFLMGSNGDSTDTLRKTIGYNTRSNILMDSKSFYAYLSKYSFISRIAVWVDDQNRRVNNIMILPNVYDRLSSYEDYFTLAMSNFYISSDIQETLITNITNSELAHISNEIVWVDPVFRKYAALVYLENTGEFISTSEIYSSVKSILIDVFVESSFSRDAEVQSIAKSVVIARIQEEVGDDCRISIIFVSEQNEEAKINGFYQTSTMVNGTYVPKRVEVEFGDDPLLGLTDRNDINCSATNEVPLLRAGFTMLSNTNEQVEIQTPVNLYIKSDDTWSKIE